MKLTYFKIATLAVKIFFINNVQPECFCGPAGAVKIKKKVGNEKYPRARYYAKKACNAVF